MHPRWVIPLLSALPLMAWLTPSAIPNQLSAPPALAASVFGLPSPQPAPIASPRVLPTPTPGPLPSSVPSPAEVKLSIPELEQEVFDQVNQHRRTLGLPPLQIDRRLSEQARAHSLDMAARRVPVGHTDFRSRVRQIGRVVPGRRLRISENVAYIFSHDQPAQRAVRGWLRSDRHRPIVEGNYSLTGVGVAMGERGALYFTQVYVRRM